MQLVCIKKRIALTALEAAHCPAAQNLKVSISNWGGQKSCCWEGVPPTISGTLKFWTCSKLSPAARIQSALGE